MCLCGQVRGPVSFHFHPPTLCFLSSSCPPFLSASPSSALVILWLVLPSVFQTHGLFEVFSQCNYTMTRKWKLEDKESRTRFSGTAERNVHVYILDKPKHKEANISGLC